MPQRYAEIIKNYLIHNFILKRYLVCAWQLGSQYITTFSSVSFFFAFHIN